MADQSVSREQQIVKNHEKWKKWKLQLQQRNAEQPQRLLPIGKPEDNAYNYAKKLIEKLQQAEKYQCPISKNVADELETNACVVCFQLMIPPYIPMILFPCGHNICRICLLNKNETQKLFKCPLCRSNIKNYAENHNLMKLICTYTNKKQLLQKMTQTEMKKKEQGDKITKLTQHCHLLENEKKILDEELVQLKKNKKIMEEVIDRLLDEKRRCRKELDALQEEARLINKHMSQKQQEIEKIGNKILQLEQKEKIILETLEPLRGQKQKMEMEAATKLINKC